MTVRRALNGNMPGNAVELLEPDLVEVGVIGPAFGVQGGVKVYPHSGGGDALLAARDWWLSSGAQWRKVEAVGAKHHGTAITARLIGCDDRDVALALKGWSVHVRRADFPAPDDNEFYWVDLIGLDVVNLGGEVLGKVLGLIDNSAHSVLRVGAQVEAFAEDAADEGVSPVAGKPAAVAAADERLIPFVDAYVRDVDLSARRIVVDWQSDY